MHALTSKAWVRATLAVGLGAVLLALYARGSWGLGFVALLPWLWWLDQPAGWGRRLLRAWVLSLAFVLAAFTWFGTAIAHYAQWPQLQGQAVLLLIAPLLQPQLIAWALVRQALDGRRQPWLRAWAAAAAWVGVEWLWPKLLGDTLAHGLYPAGQLRQAAALGGTAGLTLMLLLVHEALAQALAQALSQVGPAWRTRARAMLAPLGLALLLPLGLLGYGASREAPRLDAGLPLLRVGLVQANIADYEGRRQSQGSYAVVREVLDVHYAMSYDAVERQHADAVLWSETIYPTTFGQPKSETGAQLDQEIASIVNAAGVPFVFGTYDRDSAGEYNAAAFLQPQQGLLGLYRKTRLFPFTEQVPAWLDGPLLQRWLPWAGRWQPGSGARVFPLRLRDGRELPVQPLICRDDVDPSLAIAGARLGARALLTMSNDAWFSADPLGARLHQAVAAFRSIETGLPQFRVTTNGYSAVIDARGTVHAAGDFGQRALVVGALPVPEPAPTLLVRWGDWVGALCLLSLAGLLLARWRPLRGWAPPPVAPLAWPLRVRVVSPAWRAGIAALRGLSRLSVLGLGLALLLDEGLRTQSLLQLRLVAALVLAPEAAAWCLLQACTARLALDGGTLVLARRGGERLCCALASLRQAQGWRLPWPGPGLDLLTDEGKTWPLLLGRPHDLREALRAAGAPLAAPGEDSRAARYTLARQRLRRHRLARPAWKFLGLPLLLALPAFALHQHIAYGGFLGEYRSYGLAAYLGAFGLWWAAWAVGVLMASAAVRAGIETLAWLGLLWRPAGALSMRQGLESAGLALLYLGLPAWLALRLLGA